MKRMNYMAVICFTVMSAVSLVSSENVPFEKQVVACNMFRRKVEKLFRSSPSGLDELLQSKYSKDVVEEAKKREKAYLRSCSKSYKA
ncbi:MAG: hypothetical protein WC747_00135 [Candidatus Babeliales bacterium]